MPDQPAFESLEGLRASGKSTIAPMLAAARGAALVPTVPDAFQTLRQWMDTCGNADARMCLHLSALFAATEEIRHLLRGGVPVVVESYFARCLANHRAFGAQLDVMLPAELPRPVTYYLDCAESERQQRLAARTKPVSRWDAFAEKAVDRITEAYGQFPMRRVDTTGRSPDEVLSAILALTNEE